MKIFPLSIPDDGGKVYLKSNENGSHYCLLEQNLKTGEKHTLSCDETGDLDHIMWSFDRREPIAAIYVNDRPSVRLIDTKNPDRAKFAAVQKAFTDEVVQVTSTTLDGGKGVLFAYSDHNPGDYYLFDTRSMHAGYLLSVLDNVKPEQMAEMRPVNFKARDGQVIHGYLTLPPGKDPKNLPLVVHPHGGPLNQADHWAWDAETQMLASRGYAVLQVNYRGSRGYGEDFYAAGIRGWGGVMIDDITDGTHWTVAQGIADPKRLCIYGGSYGGYASLMSAVREPDLYRCAIGEAGVYDLNLLRNTKAETSSRFSRSEFNTFIGDSEDELRKQSPLSHLDQLKAAVMIVHSVKDPVVPINQARALMSALDARHYPYESLIKPDEGHGFYMPENREELYTRLLAFLDKNIGGAAATPSTTAGAAPESGAATTEK
ncbi:MAG: S9 family peptidase [Nevskia sp.]|nr:S9 family peptidase [Nevskia sp.]